MVAKEPEGGPPGQPTGPEGTPGADPTHEIELDPEQRRPLYRDEVVPEGDQATPSPAEAEQPTQPVEAPTTAAAAEDATQILPRTVRSGYGAARSDFDDDEDDAAPAGRLGARSRLALLVAAVAAVVIVGLAIGYAVLHLDGTPRATPGGGSSSASTPPSPSGSPSPDPNALLSEASMLSAAQAKVLSPKRTWKVALTQRGLDDQSPQPACLAPDNVSTAPPSQQSVLRLLSSSGKRSPGVLHQAEAYATPEEATQAYALSARALGGCALTGAFLRSGSVVSGLGDQSVGVVLDVSTKDKTQFRSVVLNRTGRVVNVLDVAQPAKAVDLADVAQALAGVTNRECRVAGGTCATSATVNPGPPPLGGDQPGFLAAADLPPVGSQSATWAGTVPGAPDADYTGSGCETVNWATVPAAKRLVRTYTLQGQSPIFGLDTIVVTQANAAAAQALVTKVKADLDSCGSRKLTATVSDLEAVDGTGANRTPITGWTATVSQKTTEGTARYRVGIVAAGTKTVFSFLNPQDKLDLSNRQWKTVAVRAGERATQAK